MTAYPSLNENAIEAAGLLHIGPLHQDVEARVEFEMGSGSDLRYPNSAWALDLQANPNMIS